MSRETFSGISSWTLPIVLLGAAAYSLIVFGLEGVTPPWLLSVGLFAVSLVHIVCSWAVSHPFTNYDGKCETHFDRFAVLTIFFAPMIFGFSAATMGGDAEATVPLANLMAVFGLIGISAAAGWSISRRMANQYKDKWRANRYATAVLELLAKLDTSKHLSTAEKDLIERKAMASSSADEVYAMLKAVEKADDLHDLLN